MCDRVKITLQDSNGVWHEIPPETPEARAGRLQAQRDCVKKERQLAAQPPDVLFIARMRNGWLRCTLGHSRYDTRLFEYWRNGSAKVVSAEHAYRMLDRNYPAAKETKIPRHYAIAGEINTEETP